MAFTLTLLGTDTQFSPDHVENAYDKAETLSYASTLIKGNPRATDEVIKLNNSKVAVVDGPTTLGTEVGDRISRGVYEILEAISRGETDISIVAHSRGAVEAILVAHELERIQKLLTSSNSDHTQLTNSVCPYTREGMNKTHRAAFDGLDLGKITKTIGKVKLSMLNIDPVPGGNYLGLTRLTSLAWHDPRFYIVPEIVKEYEQYTYANERTRCFKAIVPKCASSKTSFKLVSLPGHHGTGSGNLKDQQRGDNPPGKVTDHVQELVLLKIIDFLKRNNVELTPTGNENDPFAHLVPALFEAPDMGKQLKSMYLDLYQKIVENKEAYDRYNDTAYPTLGQEQAIWKMIWKRDNQRIVHYQAHNDTYLETLVPPVPGGKFLNYDHARIHLENQFGLDDGLPLSDTINRSVDRLLQICRHTKKLAESKSNPATVLGESVTQDELAAALNNPDGFQLLLEGLGLLIDEVRGVYLKADFPEPVERAKLYNAVNKAFVLFGNEPDNELAKTVLTTLNSNLETTLKTRHSELIEQNKNLFFLLKSKDFLAVLQDKIDQIKVNLENEATGEHPEDLELVYQLTHFSTALKTLVKTSPNSFQIREFIKDQRALINNLEMTSEVGKNTLEWTNLLLTEAYDDSQNYDVENIMKEVINSHNNLEKFKKSLPDFQALNGELAYEQWKLELEQTRAHLILLASNYIVEQKLNPQRDIQRYFKENKALYRQISAMALAEMPAERNHAEKEADVEENINRLNKDNEELIKRNSQLEAEHHKKVEGYKQQVKVLADHIEEQVENRRVLNEKITALQQDKSTSTAMLIDQQTLIDEKNSLISANELLSETNTVLSEENTRLKLRMNQSSLASVNKILSEANEQLQQKIDQMVNINDDEVEQKCHTVIRKKLLPYTREYLLDLAVSIKELIAPGITINNDNIPELINQVKNIQNWSADKPQQKLKRKFDVLSDLYSTLKNPDTLHHSDKITQFYSKLGTAKKDLQKHRDPKWIRYCTNLAIVFGIIATGVLPGLAALAIATTISDTSPKFWHSTGQGFFDNSVDEKDNLPASVLDKKAGGQP